MAACVIRVLSGPDVPAPTVEELDCSPEELAGPLPERFLEACGLTAEDIAAALAPARAAATGPGRGALLRVQVSPGPPRLEVLGERHESGGRLARRRLSRRRADRPAAPEPEATLGVER
jgi:hypothetical protein